MARTLVRAHTLLTLDGNAPLANGALVVEDGVIARVGSLSELTAAGPYDAMIGDPTRHLALPGLVNGHHHSLRPGRIELPAAPLERWRLRSRLRRLPPLTPEETYDHALWGTLRMLRGGVTAVIDHYPLDPHLEDLGVPVGIQAYLDAGVRAALCVSCTDQQPLAYDDDAFVATLPPALAARLTGGPAFDADAFFAVWERLHARYDGAGDGRVRVGLAPGGPQWCSDALLRRIRQTAAGHGDAPVQIHLLETRYQALYGYRRYGQSVVRHLAEIGFFGPATSAAHGVWLSAADQRLLAELGAVVVHNPSSNLILHSGILPLADLLDAGVAVGFGLDAAGLQEDLDMLLDLRLALLLHRRPGIAARAISAADLLAAATHGGAAALGAPLPLGRLAPGHAADIVLVDRARLYDSPYVSPLAPVEDVLLRRGSREAVEHVIVAGRPVVADGRAVGIDEAALAARVARSLERIYPVIGTADALFEEVELYVTAFYARWDAESGELLPPGSQYNTR